MLFDIILIGGLIVASIKAFSAGDKRDASICVIIAALIFLFSPQGRAIIGGITGDVAFAEKPTVENGKLLITEKFNHNIIPLMYEDGYQIQIRGTIKNVSGHELDYLVVSLSIKDKEGNKIDSIMKTMMDLKNGDSWKIEDVHNCYKIKYPDEPTIEIQSIDVSYKM